MGQAGILEHRARRRLAPFKEGREKEGALKTILEGEVKNAICSTPGSHEKSQIR